MPVHTAREIYRFARMAGFSPDQSVTMTAIALAESGGNPRAHNPRGEDSRGLWQINLAAHRDWAGRLDLYDPVQNARAAFRVSGGGRDVSPWTVTHGDSPRYLTYRAEAQAAAQACGDPPGLGVWTGTPGYGQPLAAGRPGGGQPVGADGPAGLVPAPGPPGGGLVGGSGGSGGSGAGAESGALRTFLDAALTQTGDRYVFGAEASGPNPAVFDCSELTQWAAGRAGVELPDGSWLQYLQLQGRGATVSVEQALRTPGALLFSFSSPPTAGGGRPGQAHVAISLGDGRTIEARGSRYGVGTWSAGDRFQYAAVIPGISDGRGGTATTAATAMPAVTTAALAGNVTAAADTDRDGVTDAMETQLGLSATAVDSDRDNISDGYELLKLKTDPLLGDTDKDKVPDSMELAVGTDPRNPDTGRTGRADGAENRTGGTTDFDTDRLTDELEQILGSDPKALDSDADGFTDGAEYRSFFDPTDPLSNPLAPPGGADPTRDPLAGAPAPSQPTRPTPKPPDPDAWGLDTPTP